jgi:PKD repeat protein
MYNSDTFHVKLIVSRGTEGVPTRCVDNCFIKYYRKRTYSTLTYTPLEGCSPLPVKFSASSASQLIYTLDFGDGNASNPSSTV